MVDPVGIGSVDVDETRCEWLVPQLPFRLAGRREGTQSIPMIAAVTSDDFVAAGRTRLRVVLPCDFERNFICFGAAIREIDFARITEHLGQFSRERRGGRISECSGQIGQARHLVACDVREFVSAISDVHTPDSSKTVEHPFALDISEVDPVA